MYIHVGFVAFTLVCIGSGHPTPTEEGREVPPAEYLYEDAHTSHYDPLEDAREMARLSVMERLLVALGAKFGETLPKPPNSLLLATVPTTIHLQSDPCPDIYTRCSSQTFFPSCQPPRNTDLDSWSRQFHLFFNLADDLDGRLDVINASLRLYKNASLPLQYPTTLLVKAFGYTRGLNKKRAKTTLVSEVWVSSSHVGWVTLPMDKIVRRWRRQRNNHGLLITVTDADLIPWDSAKIFINMDCRVGNVNSLIPLPFEVLSQEDGPKYPALNIRQGIPDDEQLDDDDEVDETSGQNLSRGDVLPSSAPQDNEFGQYRRYHDDDHNEIAPEETVTFSAGVTSEANDSDDLLLSDDPSGYDSEYAEDSILTRPRHHPTPAAWEKDSPSRTLPDSIHNGWSGSPRFRHSRGPIIPLHSQENSLSVESTTIIPSVYPEITSRRTDNFQQQHTSRERKQHRSRKQHQLNKNQEQLTRNQEHITRNQEQLTRNQEHIHRNRNI